MRQIGLESLIHQLDMGQLAYESSKSLTARILRRARLNLETFVAPAVSFSISCLAPLSKCTRLKMLDLSRDFYDLELGQLLKAIKSLPVETLSLPRSAMRRRSRLVDPGTKTGYWPASLKHLGITDWLPQDTVYWRELFDSLPQSLRSMAFDECFHWNPFWLLFYEDLTVASILELRITLRREAGDFPVSVLIKIFPNVTSIALPTPRLILDPTYLPEDVLPENQESYLEVLTFRTIPGLVRFEPFLPVSYITDLVRSNACLFKIVVPEGYLRVEDDDMANEVEQLEKETALRADKVDESGIYLA